MNKQEKLKKAKENAKKKIDFIQHAITYCVVISALAIFNNIVSPEFQWWIFPALGWGIGVLGHWVSVSNVGANWEESLVKRELKKLENK